MYSKFKYKNDNRFGFAGPFLFGALTGGVATSLFNPYNNYRPMPYNYYGPYYYR